MPGDVKPSDEWKLIMQPTGLSEDARVPAPRTAPLTNDRFGSGGWGQAGALLCPVSVHFAPGELLLKDMLGIHGIPVSRSQTPVGS